MNPNLIEIGWQNYFEQQVDAADFENGMAARVAAHFGSQVLLLTLSGELNVSIGLLENGSGNEASGDIAVGDWFLIELETNRSIRRLERKTVIARKAAGESVKPQLIAANIDTVFIVSSCNQDFNLSRLERYLAVVLQSEATPVVVLTKRDLHEDPASLRQQAEKLHTGLIVETIDARNESDAGCLTDWCKSGQTVALLGSSGVGKSTLANTLCGREIITQPIRSDDDKGRHTTTARSMHRLLDGGWLIDNPGMRELQLADCESGIDDMFEEVLEFAADCRFRNCNHNGDSGCAVETAIDEGRLDSRRVKNFLKLQSEQRRNSESLAERRDRDKKQGKFYKRVISNKKRQRGEP